MHRPHLPPTQVPGPLKLEPQPRQGMGTPARRLPVQITIGTTTLRDIAAGFGKNPDSGARDLYQTNAAVIEDAANRAGYGNSGRGRILVAGTVLDIPGNW